MTTFLEEQVEALADKVKGDETSVPFIGVFTVTPARAGIARVNIAEAASAVLRKICIEIPLRIQTECGTGFRMDTEEPNTLSNVWVGWSERHYTKYAPVELAQQPLAALRLVETREAQH